MNTCRAHIIYKISVIILVVVLLSPNFVKFSHIFQDHIHQVCKSPQKIHFHKSDLDCDFYKFKLRTQFSFSAEDFKFLFIEENYQVITSQYLFLENKQNLHFFKRGPPELI